MDIIGRSGTRRTPIYQLTANLPAKRKENILRNITFYLVLLQISIYLRVLILQDHEICHVPRNTG
jgi:hypothetical protein